MLWRDCRSSELKILILATICAVACLSSIICFIDSVTNGLEISASALLGGDRVVIGSSEINHNVVSLAENNNLRTSKSINFYSMVTAGDNFVLTSVKSVDQNYPLRGHVEISKKVDEDGQIAKTIPQPGNIWIEPRLLSLLDKKVGDSVKIGDYSVKIDALLTLEPDRILSGFSFAPRILINEKDIDKFGVLQPGSRASYRLFIVGDSDQINNFDSKVEKLLAAGEEVRTTKTSGRTVSKFLERSENYLLLAAIVNTVLAAVVIVVVTKRYSLKHVYDAAIMKSMGAGTRQLAVLYIISLAMLAILLGFIGVGFGIIIEQIIDDVISNYINFELPFPSWSAISIGFFAGLILIVGFALPNMLSTLKVSPFQVLRRTSTANRIIFRFIPVISKFMPSRFRLPLMNIFYNSGHNLLQVASFALIISVALLLYGVRNDLVDTWYRLLPEETPNYFAVNISEENMPLLRQQLEEQNILFSEFYPIIRGELIAINGAPASMHRPLNLTWTMNLPLDNEVISGRWFTSDDYGKNFISIEKGFAERLNVAIGDSITMQLFSTEITAEIISIRTLEWESFTPNFFIIYPSGLIDLPVTYMSSMYADDSKKSFMASLVKEFDEMNLIATTAIFKQFNDTLNVVSSIVSYIWFFTLVIGILLLFAVVMSNINVRNYQNNLLRTFGVRKIKLLEIQMIEFIILGGFSGFIGALISYFIAYYFVITRLDLRFIFDWKLILSGIVTGITIMLIGGMLGTRKALNTAPVKLFRNLS